MLMGLKEHILNQLTSWIFLAICNILVRDAVAQNNLPVFSHFAVFAYTLHCKEDQIYVFQEMKLHGLGPNFHIHVSVSDLYIPIICPPIKAK